MSSRQPITTDLSTGRFISALFLRFSVKTPRGLTTNHTPVHAYCAIQTMESDRALAPVKRDYSNYILLTLTHMAAPSFACLARFFPLDSSSLCYAIPGRSSVFHVPR